MSKRIERTTPQPPPADATCCTTLSDAALPTARAQDLAQAFKALGDPVRLRLLSQIASAPSGETCVCDLTPAFDLTGPTISHHLKVLREAGLIDCERRGTWVYYWAIPARLAALAHILTPATHSARTARQAEPGC